MNDNESRRPLKVRGLGIVKSFTQFLCRRNITPNQISIASIFFAVLSAWCLHNFNGDPHWWLLVLAAFFIQVRLLCNLFDGMVAVEGGKKTKSGELFNDIPDRIADPIILVAAGYAIYDVEYGATLGWSAGLLSVMTAYIRTLAASMGAPVNFQGPMAKQHRMAVMTIACVAASIETTVRDSHYSLVIALILIIVGCILTCIRRAISAYRFLEA